MNVIPIKTDYLEANEGYEKLVNFIVKDIQEGDLVVISETPISTCEGNLVDESGYEAGFLSILITELWCRYLWGYLFGRIFNIGERTIHNLRNMPREARKHKEFILKRYGLKYALQPTAEAGVDLSNVPGQYVSLLPENPDKSVFEIKRLIHEKSSKNVEVMVIDTDATYKFRKTYFTTLPKSVKNIKNDTAFLGFVLRSFTRKVGATPLACTKDMSIDSMIRLANIAEECQKDNSEDFFETVYNMGDAFSSNVDEISVEMLKSVTHIPAVIIRL